MKTFWFYELGDASGVFQGCTGPAAESIVRQCATEPGDGVPTKAVQLADNEVVVNREHLDRLINAAYAVYDHRYGSGAPLFVGGYEELRAAALQVEDRE